MSRNGRPNDAFSGARPPRHNSQASPVPPASIVSAGSGDSGRSHASDGLSLRSVPTQASVLSPGSVSSSESFYSKLLKLLGDREKYQTELERLKRELAQCEALFYLSHSDLRNRHQTLSEYLSRNAHRTDLIEGVCGAMESIIKAYEETRLTGTEEEELLCLQSYLEGQGKRLNSVPGLAREIADLEHMQALVEEFGADTSKLQRRQERLEISKKLLQAELSDLSLMEQQSPIHHYLSLRQFNAASSAMRLLRPVSGEEAASSDVTLVLEKLKKIEEAVFWVLTLFDPLANAKIALENMIKALSNQLKKMPDHQIAQSSTEVQRFYEGLSKKVGFDAWASSAADFLESCLGKLSVIERVGQPHPDAELVAKLRGKLEALASVQSALYRIQPNGEENELRLQIEAFQHSLDCLNALFPEINTKFPELFDFSYSVMSRLGTTETRTLEPIRILTEAMRFYASGVMIDALPAESGFAYVFTGQKTNTKALDLSTIPREEIKKNHKKFKELFSQRLEHFYLPEISAQSWKELATKFASRDNCPFLQACLSDRRITFSDLYNIWQEASKLRDESLIFKVSELLSKTPLIFLSQRLARQHLISFKEGLLSELFQARDQVIIANREALDALPMHHIASLLTRDGRQDLLEKYKNAISCETSLKVMRTPIFMGSKKIDKSKSPDSMVLVEREKAFSKVAEEIQGNEKNKRALSSRLVEFKKILPDYRKTIAESIDALLYALNDKLVAETKKQMAATRSGSISLEIVESEKRIVGQLQNIQISIDALSGCIGAPDTSLGDKIDKIVDLEAQLKGFIRSFSKLEEEEGEEAKMLLKVATRLKELLKLLQKEAKLAVFPLLKILRLEKAESVFQEAASQHDAGQASDLISLTQSMIHALNLLRPMPAYRDLQWYASERKEISEKLDAVLESLNQIKVILSYAKEHDIFSIEFKILNLKKEIEAMSALPVKWIEDAIAYLNKKIAFHASMQSKDGVSFLAYARVEEQKKNPTLAEEDFEELLRPYQVWQENGFMLGAGVTTAMFYAYQDWSSVRDREMMVTHTLADVLDPMRSSFSASKSELEKLIHRFRNNFFSNDDLMDILENCASLRAAIFASMQSAQVEKTKNDGLVCVRDVESIQDVLSKKLIGEIQRSQDVMLILLDTAISVINEMLEKLQSYSFTSEAEGIAFSQYRELSTAIRDNFVAIRDDRNNTLFSFLGWIDYLNEVLVGIEGSVHKKKHSNLFLSLKALLQDLKETINAYDREKEKVTAQSVQVTEILFVFKIAYLKSQLHGINELLPRFQSLLDQTSVLIKELSLSMVGYKDLNIRALFAALENSLTSYHEILVESDNSDEDRAALEQAISVLENQKTILSNFKDALVELYRESNDCRQRMKDYPNKSGFFNYCFLQLLQQKFEFSGLWASCLDLSDRRVNLFLPDFPRAKSESSFGDHSTHLGSLVSIFSGVKPTRPASITASSRLRKKPSQSSLFSSQSVSRAPATPAFPDDLGLSLVPVAGNDHCFYTAVSLYFDGETSNGLRERLAGYLESNSSYDEKIYAMQNANELLRYPENLTEIKIAYLQGLRGRAWADQIEIQVLSDIFNRPVIVLNKNGTLRQGHDHENAMSRGIENAIFVVYNGHNHYSAAIIKAGFNAVDVYQQLWGAHPAQAMLEKSVSRKSLLH